MSVCFLVTGTGPAVVNEPKRDDLIAVFDTELAAAAQRDTLITLDLATATKDYGALNVRQATSLDGLAKCVIVTETEVMELGGTHKGISMTKTCERIYAKYAISQFGTT